MVDREDLRELAAITGLGLLLVLLTVARFALAVVVRVVDAFVFAVIVTGVFMTVAWFVAG